RKSLRMRNLLKLLAEFLPHVFEFSRVAGPLGPACGNGLKDELHIRGLALILEQLGIFIVLNAVTDGLQTNSRSRFAGRNRARWVKKNPVAGSGDAWTASVGVQIVPTIDGVSRGPTIGAIVKNARGALHPV